MYAKYTEVLKNIMENEQTKPLLEKVLSTYPLYVKKSKEEYIPSYIPTREQLNTKILNAYKYREIGFETVGRFLDELEIAMNEIMPTYNLLFLTADLDYNIIYNVDYVKTIDTDRAGESSNTIKGTDSNTHTENTSGNRELNGETSAEHTENTQTESGSNANTKKIHSDTPQDSLGISTKNIDTVDYGDEAEWNENISEDNSETDVTGTDSGTTKETEKTSGNTSRTSAGESQTTSAGENSQTEKTLETIKGNYGVVSAQELVLKYRQTILNIEQMIIEDERISELFMRVY